MMIELDNLQHVISLVNSWIDSYISKYMHSRIRVADLGFPRLPSYYSNHLLSNSYVVVLKKVETPPLHDFGLGDLTLFEPGVYGGITYKDTYFVVKGEEKDESLHFHELIHILQWNELEADKFILAYALGLLEFGYSDSPFERIAYELQDKFDSGMQIENLEATVRRHCRLQADTLLG